MTDRSLRILFLAPQPFFEVRGTPLAVLHMTRALAALGHQVDLLTFPRGQAAPVEGVRHLRSLGLPVGRVKAGPSLAFIRGLDQQSPKAAVVDCSVR